MADHEKRSSVRRGDLDGRTDTRDRAHSYNVSHGAISQNLI
jgi:hypothetical protein